MSMLLRSKRYFEALVDAELIFARGSPKILHNMPEAYYACLYSVKDLNAMHSIVGMENFGNKQFLAILAGRPIPGMIDVAMALEDGVIEADDDGA
eukprot:9467017-Pyramimonas_sp.AAC.1